MRPMMVVVAPPTRGERLSGPHVLEDLGVEQLAPQPAVKTLRITILPRRPRLDVQRLDACSREEPADRSGDELRAVVAANALRHAANHEQVAQHIQHAVRRHPSIHFQRQTFARVFIDDRKPLDRTAVLDAIEDEVPSPNVVFVLGPTPHATAGGRAQSTLFSLFLRHLKALLPPQTVYSLAIHAPAFTPQKHRDEAIAVSRMLTNQFQHSCHETLFFFILLRSVTLRAPRLAQNLAGPTLAHSEARLHLGNRSSPARRAQ